MNREMWEKCLPFSPITVLLSLAWSASLLTTSLVMLFGPCVFMCTHPGFSKSLLLNMCIVIACGFACFARWWPDVLIAIAQCNLEKLLLSLPGLSYPSGQEIVNHNLKGFRSIGHYCESIGKENWLFNRLRTEPTLFRCECLARCFVVVDHKDGHISFYDNERGNWPEAKITPSLAFLLGQHATVLTFDARLYHANKGTLVLGTRTIADIICYLEELYHDAVELRQLVSRQKRDLDVMLEIATALQSDKDILRHKSIRPACEKLVTWLRVLGAVDNDYSLNGMSNTSSCSATTWKFVSIVLRDTVERAVKHSDRSKTDLGWWHLYNAVRTSVRAGLVDEQLNPDEWFPLPEIPQPKERHRKPKRTLTTVTQTGTGSPAESA